jgi:hypothetical protein
MSRSFILLFLLFLFSFNGVSQIYNRHIDWPTAKNSSEHDSENAASPRKNYPYLWFDNVAYPDPISMLPHYYELIPLPNRINHSSQISVSIDDQGFELLNDAEQRIIDAIEISLIEEQKFDFRVHKSRGESYLQVTVPAIRLNKSTGQKQKLNQFVIRVQENPGVSYLQTSHSYASQSVLAEGTWKSIRVSQSGIHRITYSELQSMGFSNLENVSLWGHGGKQLPFLNNVSSPDDLQQIPIWMEKGSDGSFNQGDYILFYAQGPVTWSKSPTDSMFIHTIHDYSDHIQYLITTSKPNLLRIPSVSNPAEPHTRTSSSYDALVYFERNDTNLIKSGRQWFGELFDVYTSRTYTTGLNQPTAGGKALIRVSSAARSSSVSSFTLKANGNILGLLSLESVNLTSLYNFFAKLSTKTFSFPYSQGELTLELTYNKPSPASKAWLDFITVNARQNLSFGSNQLDFRDTESVDQGAITQFNISNAPTNVMVWDITNFYDPTNLNLTIEGGNASFKIETESLREFIAFSLSQAFSVTIVGDVANQNIHGQPQPEMVIVTHPNYLTHAEELAQIHMENSGLRTLIVTNQQVYNEFSSGNPDVSAIRNMMRMFYSRSTNELDMPRYLLLFGDGSYDNHSQSLSNTNYVLTYQSANSTYVSSSIVSDDYYGLLDENEGEQSGLLDIGIGRIPCNTKEEASIAVSKIRDYLHNSSNGSWHNQLSFIGDDGDYNVHMSDSDFLALYVQENYPRYNIEKIFFDSYPLITTAQGARYPEVTNAINNRANQGALIMNYMGHANARWLSHEKVLMIEDIYSWRNLDRLPLFVTATCEFSRFDDFSFKSAGEHILFAPRGGSVGLVSTSRVVYANPNFVLSKNFFKTIFSHRESNDVRASEKYYRLGDALRIAKILTTGDNKRNFLLLGDPALMLRYPDVELAVTEINGKPIGANLDTLKALDHIVVKGVVSGPRYMTDFDGEAVITLYDKEKDMTTLSNQGGAPFNYTSRQSTIYRGRSSIVNGQFSASFIIPKDIMYRYGNGRFSLFAHNNIITGSGYFEDFIIGGISDIVGNDSMGPAIDIYMNDRNFVPGGITDPNPKLLIHLTDSSGMNTTGTGIGHDLIATIVGEEANSYVLNDYYEADLDNFQSGKVEYQLSGLKSGDYTVNVKAWDVYNNSSESSIEFKVKTDEAIELKHVLNYPNPFTESTGFYFEHNQPFEYFDISIQIFSPSGKLVKTIEHFFPGSGSYRIGPIHWDGLDDFGDRIGRGVYFYRLRVRLSNGKTAHIFQKLVILK